MSPSRAVLAVVLLLLLQTGVARADDSGDRARATFVEGTALVEKAQWAEALAAFERARALRPHPITTFNMAACERAMGHYTRARRLYTEALADPADGTKKLPDSLSGEARALLGEIDRLLVRITATVEPGGSQLAVDGRPLEKGANGDLIAGLLPAGPGEPTPTGTFVIVMDPGLHVLMFTRRGFRDVSVARTFESGRAETMRLELTEIPAVIKISANKPGAIVAVNGMDVGPAPVDVRRPAGNYHVVIRRTGFDPYDARLSVEPGQESRLEATLKPSNPSLFSRWWFWTAAGVVIAGAATTTWLVTRPDPTRPDVPAGTLGWKVDIR